MPSTCQGSTDPQAEHSIASSNCSTTDANWPPQCCLHEPVAEPFNTMHHLCSCMTFLHHQNAVPAFLTTCSSSTSACKRQGTHNCSCCLHASGHFSPTDTSSPPQIFTPTSTSFARHQPPACTPPALASVHVVCRGELCWLPQLPNGDLCLLQRLSVIVLGGHSSSRLPLWLLWLGLV